MKNSNSSEKENMKYLSAMHALVRIHVRGILDNNPRAMLDPRTTVHEEWVGTGFFITIDGVEGYILTNAHVAKNAIHIEIRSMLTSEEPFKAITVGLVESLEPDVALLKFSEEELVRFKKFAKIKKLPFLEFANSENIRRGEEIKAIGYPLGVVEPSMTGGEISNFISGSLESVERFVTDAAINLGNSGGPSIMKNTKVIGLNTAVMVEAANISFITPIHLVKNILPQLLKGEDVRLCKLGAYIQKNSAANAQYLNQSSVQGLIINNILKKSLAKSAGLKRHDVLLAINGNALDRHGNVIGGKYAHRKNIHDLLYGSTYGEKIHFKISRKGKIMNLSTLHFPSAPDLAENVPAVNSRIFYVFEGLVLQNVCVDVLTSIEEIYLLDGISLYRDYIEAHSQIIVTEIDEDSQGSEVDLHIGDYITHVNGKRVKTIKQFTAAIKRTSEINAKIILSTSTGSFGVFSFNNN